jgi:hypothetical protein
MRKTNSLPGLLFAVILGVGLALAYLEYTVSAFGESASIAGVALVIAIIASYSIKIADQWEKTVVLDYSLLSRSSKQYLIGSTPG